MITCLKIKSIVIALISVSTLICNARSINTDENTTLKKDSVILFKFIPKNRNFYSPFKGNEDAIIHTVQLIERHRLDIESGRAYLLIRGFCGSFSTHKENLAAAKERSNHVKSWFITHHGMKEEYYRTKNSTCSYNNLKDVVALIGINYVEGYTHAETRYDNESYTTDTNKTNDGFQKLQPYRKLYQNQSESILPEFQKRKQKDNRLYLKTNMIYDCAIMPSLEIEYRIDKKWSLSVEGNMAWWHNNNKHKYYQIATILPEIRYWIHRKNNLHGHYTGLFGGGGWYDLENGKTGYRGEGGMIGISYGYMFPVGKNFAFEAGIGAGLMTTKYDLYIPIDKHYVYQQTNRFNYFGPLKIKFALVWNINLTTGKKGGKS